MACYNTSYITSQIALGTTSSVMAALLAATHALSGRMKKYVDVRDKRRQSRA
jgi:galactokinase/mevalonate kinase-like predicted kinase